MTPFCAENAPAEAARRFVARRGPDAGVERVPFGCWWAGFAHQSAQPPQGCWSLSCWLLAPREPTIEQRNRRRARSNGWHQPSAAKACRALVASVQRDKELSAATLEAAGQVEKATEKVEVGLGAASAARGGARGASHGRGDRPQLGRGPLRPAPRCSRRSRRGGARPLHCPLHHGQPFAAVGGLISKDFVRSP